MKRSSLMWSWAGGVVFLGGLMACQALAKLESRSADPVATGCSLPSVGNGRVRLVNGGVAGATSDFCVRASGASSWGRPIFRDGGDDALCLGTDSQPGGLPYAQATVPFAEPVGNIDVKAIPAGSTCAAAATSEVDGVTIGDASAGAPVMTLVRYGGGSGAEALIALPEEVSTTAASTLYVRLLNALAGNTSISFGTADADSLPTKLNLLVNATPVPPGTLLSPGAGSIGNVDTSGYLQLFPGSFNLGASVAGDATNKAIMVQPTLTNEGERSLFVIGDPNDAQNLHPVRGLYCNDIPSTTQATQAAADAGTATNVPPYPSQDLALLADCQLSKLPTLLVDVIDTGLYGPNAPFELDRQKAIPDAIAARDADLMCVIETDRLADRQKIIDAAKATNYPYSYIVDTTTTDPPSNADDVRPPPANPPCGGSVNQAAVQAAYDCALQHCTTSTDPATGFLNQSTNCLESKCPAQLGPLAHLGADPTSSAQIFADVSCFDCIIVGLSSGQVVSDIKTQCGTLAQYPYAFNGQTPSMILSKYPLVKTDRYILPSTGFRRTILKSQVQLEDQTIDFFCIQLASPLLDTELPYVGNYGKDVHASKENGYEDEQVLTAKRTVAWAQSEADKDGLPAIIVGDLHANAATTGDPDAGVVTLTAISPEVPPLFDIASGGPFDPVIPQGYTPTCDYCGGGVQNPYNTQKYSYAFMHAYTYKFPPNAGRSDTLWGTDNGAVPLSGSQYEPPPPSGHGPLSEYYPHEYVILRPK